MSELDFACRVCGKECTVAPDPPLRAICPDCCDDHDYLYDRYAREHYCANCGKPRPDDY
jgi:hypothetical protein